MYKYGHFCQSHMLAAPLLGRLATIWSRLERKSALDSGAESPSLSCFSRQLGWPLNSVDWESFVHWEVPRHTKGYEGPGTSFHKQPGQSTGHGVLTGRSYPDHTMFLKESWVSTVDWKMGPRTTLNNNNNNSNNNKKRAKDQTGGELHFQDDFREWIGKDDLHTFIAQNHQR